MYEIQAVDCGDPTSEVMTAKEQFLTGSPPVTKNYLSKGILKCIVGYRWTDGMLFKNFTCHETGYWTAFAACQGTIFAF